MSEGSSSGEALRQLQICNACRYCEGYCETFGAMGRQPLLTEAGVSHLANICHDCRACYQACMYTAPHEFAVNIPLALSAVRVETYEQYSPPHALGRLLRRGTSGAAILAAAFAAIVTVSIGTWRGFDNLAKETDGPGAFYVVVPAWLMITAGLVFGIAAGILLLVGQVLYWRDNYRGTLPWRYGRAWLSALRSAALLAAMRGGGDGCYYPEKSSPSHLRRWMHSLTAYGFLLTFAATCAAAIYEHLLDRLPPYGFWTAPVLLGTIGGVMMCLGVAGLVYLKRTADVRLGDERARTLDYAFLVTLFLLAFTGLLLLVLRSTPAMPVLLTVHLGVVGAFFVTMPYGKLVHATFRFSALLKDRLELAADAQQLVRQSDVLLPADPDAFDGNTV